MLYNYSFEIAAAIMMALLLFITLINPNFELERTKSFFWFLLSSFFESLLNIVSSWSLAHPEYVSNYGNQWICFCFFLSEAFTSILFFKYIATLCEPSKKIRILYSRLAMIPFGAFVILIITNKFLHLLYTIEGGVYTQGSMAWYGYAYIGLFIVCSFLVSTTAKNTIRGRNRYAVVLAALVSCVGIIIQYQVKSLILTGFSNTIVLYMFFIFVQNPDELNDKTAGVKNNRAFFLHFENAVEMEKPLKVLLVDTFQPTHLSVLYGYKTGKEVLDELASFIENIAGQNNTFRISSHVFALVVKSDEEVAEKRAAIEERFSKPFLIDNLEIHIPAKTAYMRYPEDVSSVKDFYGLELFVKELLRNEPLISSLDVDEDIKKQYRRIAEVDGAIKRALEEKSLQVYFQPIYDIKQKKFSTLEALARMFDSELGFVTPDEFIARAENSGLIIPLDLMILEKTCEFLANQIIPVNDRLEIESVHINISALQCMQPNMDETILAIIDKYKVPRSMIVLEITERATITAAELMEKHMKSLNSSGIRFALDDYGTGNSNCSYLIEYPFDKVKFDKSMVWAYFKNETGKVILEGEMQTIHKLNIPIVAEGVETAEQLEEMSRLCVEGIQGYFFSKPLAGEDLLDFLFRQNIGSI